MLYGEINRQRLKIINEHVVADTIDYLEARFAFSEDWDGLEKWAHFAKDGEVYDIRLTDNCVRKEDHLNLSAGIWKVYLHGNEFSGGKVIERITTNAAILKVEPTGALDGEPFPEMPASVTEQILARLDDVEQNGGGGGGGVQVDDTLSKAGHAADAAAVGDALKTKLGAGELDGAVNTALSRAKESGEFDGPPGITPRIGENGNWWIGDIDTGIPAQGEPGVPGASQTISVSERNPMYGGGVIITVTNPDGTFSTSIVRDGADGKQGIPGDPGVYVGTDAPPAGTKVWVDPNGKRTKIPQIDETLSRTGYAADAKETGERLTNISKEIADKLDADKLTEAINTALAQAKESGEFDGEPGEDYVLTDLDKLQIAAIVIGELPKYAGEVENA